jgi:hypothetical protein
MLVRVTAPHFVAGLVIVNGVCTEAAPILQWCVGKSRTWLKTAFRKKRWIARIPRAQFAAHQSTIKNLPEPAAKWPQRSIARNAAEAAVKGASWRN